ncbi:factor-independent urate hydroxylase [Subtercola boreus]|uniref:Uricase n=1 Tax=Subtercola boreus TaxID=120213 RepID=A0A3E0WD16_9MICO|nr:urate oxidase [Subtercola boreus]RFA21986.1 urate oxidase [Subtercola boreus]RFA22166.1 urate oxidase [Subtercola boreus]RFA28028.1 urate oxidase [Subtercola boreus]
MSIVLGPNRYGKAESRVVRIYRDESRHEIRDINVSTALRGDFAGAHLFGDQSKVLPTDSQKQTAYSFAKEKGLVSIEDYGMTLGAHLVDTVEHIDSARVEIEEFAWQRVLVDGTEHDHTWTRQGQETRTAAIVVTGRGDERQTTVIAGFKDLIILKSTGSEFAGFYEDAYTVLEPTHDRIMATSLVAQWRFTEAPADWEANYPAVKQILVATFATVYSLALQQTLYEMGKAVLEAFDEIAEIRFSAPNKHHFLFNLSPFGVENNNEVFNADDRPYGLIQATVLRDDVAPAPAEAWDSYTGLV